MDVREELRSLTTDVPVPPAGDGVEVFHRGRRRRIRRRAGAGLTGLALIVALVAVALPGVPPTGVTIEDRIADQPQEEVPDPGDPEGPDGAPGADDAGTSDAPPADGGTSAPDGTTTPEGTDAPDAPPAPTATPTASTVPPLSGDATTADGEQEPGGDVALTLTDVRVGSHDGFDRVVMELEGDGQVGWFITAGDRAIHDGSGEEIEMAGDGVLTVALRGILIPPDRPAGVEGFPSGRVGPPSGAGALTEIQVGHIFEGQQQVFVGTTRPVAYRIARFDGPQRLVIDLVHP
jgi:hypothetical protein